MYERRAQWKQADAELRAWIKMDAKNPTAWRRLATIFFRTDRHDKALETLATLKSFDDSQPRPEVIMGLMYQQIGQLDKAAQQMKTAAEADKDDLNTQIAVARWALTAGHQEMLSTCTARAGKLQPESPAIRALTAMSRRYAGKPEEAETIFRELLEQNPASFDATNGLALSLLEQDDEEKHRQAVEYAQVNAQSYKDLRTIRGRGAAGTFAWALHRVGKSQEAARIIQAVVKSGEIAPELGYFAAAILAAHGGDQIAAELLKASLSSSVAFPQRDAARSLMLKIEERS